MAKTPKLTPQWFFACEYAFIDIEHKLGVVGIIRHLAVPKLPVSRRQITLVVSLKEAPQAGVVDLRIDIHPPSGQVIHPNKRELVDIAVVESYLFVTLREFPMREEGIHRITLGVGADDLAIFEIPVFLEQESGPVH